MDTSREGSRAANIPSQQSSQPLESVSLLGELNPCGGGDPIPLLGAKLLIGRRSSCDISLHFPNISSHHCELELMNGYWYVRDLNSRNGIKVNGERCESKWLMPGDILSIAKHRYEMLYSPQGEAPPPEEEDPFAKGLLEKAGLEQPSRRSSERGSRPLHQDPAIASEQADGAFHDHARVPDEEINDSDVIDEDEQAMRWLNQND